MEVVILIIILVGLFIFFLIKRKQRNNSTQNTTPENKEDLFTFTTKNVDHNTTEITIDLNEREFIKRAKGGTLVTEIGDNEKTVEDITGFYGSDEYSPNKEYCVSFCDGYYDNNKWKTGAIALIKGEVLLFKKKIERPDTCHVSNDGIVICCDMQNSDALSGCFLIFNTNGKQILAINTTANLAACAISDNSKIAIFETCGSETDDGNKIFIVDIELKTIIQKFQNPSYFNSANIDIANKLIKFIDSRGFTFEIDFEGAQTNKDDYEKQVMTQGAVYDRLCLFKKKPDEEKLKDKRYLELLNKALIDKEASNSYGVDWIYRKIGEYYEASGDIAGAIENWEKAIQFNPKIGIKRKLDSLKKKYPPPDKA